MTRVKEIISKVITTVAFICSVSIVGIFIWGIAIMGDQYCTIQIQNTGQRQLILKTFQYTDYDKKLIVDSLALGQNEKIEIGHCINCSIPDTMDIHFDAIGFYDKNGAFNLMNRRELIEYLETMSKGDCITYIVR